MASFVKRCLPFGLVVAVSAWIAFANTSIGDYDVDGARAVHLLAEGDVSGYLSTHLLMGPFATLVQVPFAIAGGGEGLVAYQWACLPGLLALGFLGLYLAAVARRRGMPAVGSWVIAGLCLVNPITFTAIENGHPEELLTTALAVAAIAVAAQGQGRRAALLLGLALASKQWAVIAILPTLMALPGRRVHIALGAAAVACAFYLPGIVASPGSFAETQHHAAFIPGIVTPWSGWYPLANITTEGATLGGTYYSTEVHHAPALVASIAHPLIVLLVFALPLALARRRRQFGISGPEAMALLGLLALLRCVLDPVDNLYYHAPLLLALIGWDALDPRRWPLRASAAVAVVLFFEHWSWNLSSLVAFNAAYIATAVALGVALTVTLFRPAARRKDVRRHLDVRLSPAA